MQGRAEAPAAGTVLNALANGFGSAFAIDAYTRATVTLDESDTVEGKIAGAPKADTRLIERCVELVLSEYDADTRGGTVRTESDVPMAGGLKSSSAAANATVLATLDALGIEVNDGGSDGVARVDACRLGVRAARDVGVTVTGAFDDASASMLGGVSVTDNSTDQLLARDEVDWDVLVWTPDERAFSADADVERCRRIAPVADTIRDLALNGEYTQAMTINGFAFCAALGYPAEPMLAALPEVAGVSLSGTGPSFTAVGDGETLEAIQDDWNAQDGDTWLTTTQTHGARTR